MTSSLSYPVRANIGSATVGTLASAISSSATTGFTFNVNSGTLTNFLDVAYGAAPAAGVAIVLAIDYGTSSAEKMLCTYSGGTFTIQQRYYDQQPSTSSTTHAVNATVIPVLSATEVAEHNAAVQSLVHVLTNAGTIGTPGAVTVDGSVSVGSANTAAHSDHSHSISSSSLAGWLSGASIPGSSVSGALASSVTIDASKLTGTLTTAQLTNASNAWYTSITSGSVPFGSVFPSTPQISQSVTGFPSYLITFTCTAKNLDTTTARNVLAEIGFGAGSTAGSATQIASTTNTVSGAVGGTNTGFSTLTCTYVVTGQTPATTYTAGGYVTIGGSTAGSIVNATLSIVGLA